MTVMACPDCGARNRVADRPGFQSARCGKCQALLFPQFAAAATRPTAAQPAGPAHGDPGDPPRGRPAPPRGRRKAQRPGGRPGGIRAALDAGPAGRALKYLGYGLLMALTVLVVSLHDAPVYGAGANNMQAGVLTAIGLGAVALNWLRPGTRAGRLAGRIWGLCLVIMVTTLAFRLVLARDPEIRARPGAQVLAVLGTDRGPGWVLAHLRRDKPESAFGFADLRRSLPPALRPALSPAAAISEARETLQRSDDLLDLLK